MLFFKIANELFIILASLVPWTNCYDVVGHIWNRVAN